MAPILTARDVTLRFPGAPQPVIDGLDLTVERSQFLAVVGGSGVGKSTLLRAVAGLIGIERGMIEIDAEERPGQRRRAIVFQDGRLMPWRTLRDNVAFGLEGLKLSSDERDRRIDDVLELTGLRHLADRYPHQLSGGQAQRGGIARALAVKPDILLMDEPFSAVDAITRASLQDELIRIWQVSGAAVLFVTHDISEAVLLADRVIVLAGGPAHVALDTQIELARPRERGGDAAATLAAAIEAAL